MRGAAKNVIKIDVLLVEPVTIEAATLLTQYCPDRVDTMWRDCDCHAATRHCDSYYLLGSTCMSVQGLQDPLCYGSKIFDYSSPTEAQLRLAPNMPCMTLVRLCTYQCIAPGTTPRARVGDLTCVKSIASPLEQILGSNAPIKTVYFPLLSVNIDQIPLIQGMFIGQIRSNPHLLPVGW